jgi:apolipoprotein N-acyltransferase
LTHATLSTLARVVLGLFLAVLGGIAFVLAFPPYEIWPLALVGFVPVLVSQYRIMPPRLSSLASAVGIAVWLQGYLGPIFAPIGTFMVWLPLIAGGISLLTENGQRAFHAQTGYRWFVPAGVAGWAGSEMIRLFIPIAGTWAFIAYPFYRQSWLIQPVSIVGIIGMGMLVMMVNHVLALTVMVWLDSHGKSAADTPALQPGVLRGWQAAGGIVVAIWVAAGLVLWNTPLDTPIVRVAAIQPEVSVIVSANTGQTALAERMREGMKEQSRQVAAQGAQFIVWPEGSLLWDPQVEDRIDLRGLAAETGAHLALGYVVIMEEGFRNEATVLDPRGEFLGVFGKDHPVVFAGETSLTRGSYPVYETPLGVLGTIICYDLDYTDTARKLAAQGAQLIGVPSNDWGSIAEKHYTHVVFRAVENRVAMVKADGGFDSAIIDPYGRIHALAAFPEGGEATLVADVPIGDGRGTLSTRLGDWAGWLGLAGMIFFGVGGKWLEGRSRPA